MIPLVVVLAALSLLSSESVCVSRQPAPAQAARMRCRASTVEHLDRLDSSAQTGRSQSPVGGKGDYQPIGLRGGRCCCFQLYGDNFEVPLTERGELACHSG